MPRVLVLNKFPIKKICNLFLAIIFIFALFAPNAEAAKLDVVPTFGSVNVGDNIKIKVVLSSSDQSSNAVSGVVSFSSNLLTLNSVSKSDSIISLWPVEPSYSNQTGTANFEGVVLTGYKGSGGTILTLYFKAKSAGNATISFSNASVLANDGQGTQILSSTGEARFEISELKGIVPVETKVNNTVTSPEKVASTLSLEEIKKKDEMDPRSRFLITSTDKKPGAPYKIEIDNTPYVWNDSGNHIFETISLSKGIHSIKVYVENTNSEVISKSLTFSNIGILTPNFTDYSSNVVEGGYIVAKGVADPSTFIIINSDFISKNGDTKHESETIKSNEKGLFTYVSSSKVLAGIYTLDASARTSGGVDSDASTPIKISVGPNKMNIVGSIVNTFSLIIPAVALLILLILITIFGWYKILHYKVNMKKRLMQTKALVDKSFSILEEDLDEEAKILKKARGMQSLSEDEKSFVNQFKKDIESAERTIDEDIKDSNKII